MTAPPAAAGPTRPTRVYASYLTPLEGGETLPIIIAEDGSVPHLPHVYVLFVRATRAAPSTLHKHLHRIAELFTLWEVEYGESLDVFLVRGQFPERRAVEGLMLRANRESARTTARRRAAAWGGFLEWAADEENWLPLVRAKPPAERTRERLHIAEGIRSRLHEAADTVVRRGKKLPIVELTAPELQIITDLIAPRADGTFGDSIFDEGVRLRNWLLFCLTRHCGIRVGEALALKVDALPKLTDRDRVARALLKNTELLEPQRISIVRIPDDPDNTRRDVSVKRDSRSVGIPDTVVDVWWRYVDGAEVDARPRSRSPFLLLTEDGAPLSVSGARGVRDVLRLKGATAYEDRHGRPSRNLPILRWHSFRHQRAIEGLDEFFPDGVDTPGRRAEFLDYFGWVSLRSALPYIRRLNARAAHNIATRDIV